MATDQDRKKLVKLEYDRLVKLFDGADEQKQKLLEGHIWENAELRVQISAIAQLPLIRVHPNNPAIQKETPAGKMLIRLRASYINSTKLLCKELGVPEMDNDDLEDFE